MKLPFAPPTARSLVRPPDIIPNLDYIEYANRNRKGHNDNPTHCRLHNRNRRARTVRRRRNPISTHRPIPRRNVDGNLLAPSAPPSTGNARRKLANHRRIHLMDRMGKVLVLRPPLARLFVHRSCTDLTAQLSVCVQ